MLEEGEECDNANLNADDSGCLDACVSATCGDGLLRMDLPKASKDMRLATMERGTTTLEPVSLIALSQAAAMDLGDKTLLRVKRDTRPVTMARLILRSAMHLIARLLSAAMVM